MKTARPRLLVVLPVLLGLAACADYEYGPIADSKPYGYKDALNPDGGYTLLVITPELEGPQLAHQYWDARAAELCPAGVERKIIFRAERPTVLYDYNGGRPGDFHLEGYAYCAGGAGEAAGEAEAPANN